MPFEGTANGQVDIDFPMNAKSLAIYNQSGSVKMQIWFHRDVSNKLTIEPTEIIEFHEVNIRNMALSGVSVKYKVVAMG